MRDRLARCSRVSGEAMLVEGSRGQVRLNPLAVNALKLEAAIARLEADLGLTPAARARLVRNGRL
jgi:P27 family predicted phage terminase small subunit